MTVYVCFDKDIECGNRPENWCAGCPKHALRGPSHSMDPARERELNRGPSDSGVQVEAEACREEFIKTGMWPNEVLYQSWCKAWKASAAWNRRAALPVADEQIKSELPPMPVFLRESLYDYEQSAVIAYVIQCARVLLAAAGQPALEDRKVMEQAIEALEDAVRVHAIHSFRAAKEVAAIAALRTRLLRHSEGKDQ